MYHLQLMIIKMAHLLLVIQLNYQVFIALAFSLVIMKYLYHQLESMLNQVLMLVKFVLKVLKQVSVTRMNRVYFLDLVENYLVQIDEF